MAERKLNEPDKPLITSQLFCRNARRENKIQTSPPSRWTLNNNKTFFWRTDASDSYQISSGECCGALGHSWSQCPNGYCWEPHFHSQSSKRDHACISAISSAWHTNVNSFSISTKTCEMRCGWWEDHVLSPRLLSLHRSVTAFKGPTKPCGMTIF